MFELQRFEREKEMFNKEYPKFGRSFSFDEKRKAYSFHKKHKRSYLNRIITYRAVDIVKSRYMGRAKDTAVPETIGWHVSSCQPLSG